MISYDFGMHQAGVLLLDRLVVMLVIGLAGRAIEVNRADLPADARHECSGARDYDCKIFSHLVWL